MKWYAAHVILYFKLLNRKQRRFRVWENIVLIRARDSDDAYAKAEEQGRQDAFDDPTLTWGGHPAQVIFAGVRKITLCVDPDTRPNHGTEISYNELEVQSEASIKSLVDGKSVMVEMLDPFPEDEDVVPTTSKNGAHQPRKVRAAN
jgi:Domain of unknown function (DUF4288)